MALFRNKSQQINSIIWPGFVDAMTALLLVLTFVLSIFMIVQFVLREKIVGQEQELNDLGAKIFGLADALGLEVVKNSDLEKKMGILSLDKEQAMQEKAKAILSLSISRKEIDKNTEAARLSAAKREAMQALIASLNIKVSDQGDKLNETEKTRLLEAEAAQVLRNRLEESDDALTMMTLALEEKRKVAEETLTLLAAANATQDILKKAEKKSFNEIERQAALLAHAQTYLTDEEKLTIESKRKLVLLNEQTLALRSQLRQLQSIIGGEGDGTSAAELEIDKLSGSLNLALARKTFEQKKLAELERKERILLEAKTKNLEKFRSEFFGQVRNLLEGQDGVRMVGDRFVFSSEVLFSAGSDILGSGGQKELEKVAYILKKVADKIPAEIDWILRVDGHTDSRPLSEDSGFEDNWELSQARALSVVKYLIDPLNIPANRLAANGFGEFQPLDPRQTAAAYALNRRIELKFTEK